MLGGVLDVGGRDRLDRRCERAKVEVGGAVRVQGIDVDGPPVDVGHAGGFAIRFGFGGGSEGDSVRAVGCEGVAVRAGELEVRSQLGRHVVGCSELHLPWLGVLAAGACQRRREPLAEPPIVAQARVGIQSRQKQLGTDVAYVVTSIDVALARIDGVSTLPQVRLQRLPRHWMRRSKSETSRVEMFIMVMLYFVY